MAGIFPDAGTAAGNTDRAVSPVNLVDGCTALFYRRNCIPVFDPLATNALISEVLTAINANGIEYDCNRLDNLSRALTSATNICGFPTLAELDVEPALTDTLGGCFSGEKGQINLDELVDFIYENMNYACRLPVETAPNLEQTFVAACVNGQQVSVPARSIAIGVGGVGYRYYDVVAQRFNGVWYQNDSGGPIEINITCSDDAGLWYSATGPNQNSVLINSMQADGMPLTAIIPDEHYYMVSGANRYRWTELRPSAP